MIQACRCLHALWIGTLISFSGPDIIRASGQIEASEILLESDRQVSAPGSQNLQSDSVASFTTSDNTHVEADKQNLRFKQFPLYSDNKSSFSSAVWSCLYF